MIPVFSEVHKQPTFFAHMFPTKNKNPLMNVSSVIWVKLSTATSYNSDSSDSFLEKVTWARKR